MTKQATGRYYRRHRTIRTTEGAEPVSALITRYRYGVKRRKPHYVYWHDGRVWTARNLPVERDEAGTAIAWEWTLVPIDRARAWDAFAVQTAEEGGAVVDLEIRDGRIVSATGAKGTPYEGAPLLAGDEPDDYVSDLLGLERPRREPRKGYQPRHMRAA